MPRRRERWSSATQTVANQTRKFRDRRGWSAEDLAAECAKLGAADLNQNVIANLESGRRTYVTADEVFVLAYALDVAPVHLLMPTEVDKSLDADRYMATPDRFLTVPQARAWVRGEWCPPGRDPRVYFSEVPAEEFRPGRPDAEIIARRGAAVDEDRKLDDLTDAAHATHRQDNPDES